MRANDATIHTSQFAKTNHYKSMYGLEHEALAHIQDFKIVLL